VEPTKENKKTA